MSCYDAIIHHLARLREMLEANNENICETHTIMYDDKKNKVRDMRRKKGQLVMKKCMSLI